MTSGFQFAAGRRAGPGWLGSQRRPAHNRFVVLSSIDEANPRRDPRHLSFHAVPGARRSRLMEAEAQTRRAQSQVDAARDTIEDEVWSAYSNLNTAFRQRAAATALLDSATQSYAAALESDNYGVRNLLDVTAAQKVLACLRRWFGVVRGSGLFLQSKGRY